MVARKQVPRTTLIAIGAALVIGALGALPATAPAAAEGSAAAVGPAAAAGEGRARPGVTAGEGRAEAAAASPVGHDSSAPATAPGKARVPVAGTFAYHEDGEPDGALIHGAIHSVTRIPGGTAVYFSIGGPGAVTGVEPRPNLDEDYNLDAFRSVAAIDTTGLKRYQPLNMGDQHCACSTVNDLTDLSGTKTPRAGYAVLPKLPADVSTVTIEFGFGTLIPNVPVTDKLPGPSTAATPLALGHGWPKLPTPDQLAKADPKLVTRPLVKNTANRKAATRERSDSTEIALNSDVLFDTDKATLRRDGKKTVNGVVKKLNDEGRGTVKVTGYTDNTGSSAHNDKLSKRRAGAVVKAFKARVDKDGLTFVAQGKGEKGPVASNDTAAGRQQNRRVAVAFATGGRGAGK